MIAWTLAEGIAVVRSVEFIAIAHGFHSAIGGSCLHKGESHKDLDIILYPRKTTANMPFNPLVDALTLAGFLGWKKLDHEYHGDGKTVFKVEYMGQRIDFFLMQ